MTLPTEQIEAIGKVGIGIVSIIVLGWILHTVLAENRQVIDALARQVELLERQASALERLVSIYSGGEE